MFTFSILTALLLNFYNDFKDRALRQSYARALADYRDSLSIAELELLGQRLSNSRGELAGADTLDCSLLRRHTWNLINEQVYLSRQYRPRLQFIRPATGEPLCPSPYDSRADWRILFPEGEPLVEQPTFQIMGLPRKFTYLLRAELPLDPPLHAYLSFQRAVDAPGSVFQELVVHPPYKNLRYLKSYAFALYRDGELLESAGMVFEHRFNDTLPPAGTSVLVERSERHSELIYHAPNGVVVRVVGEAGGFWRAIPLASILFVLLLLAVGLLAFFNFFLQFLPPSLHFSISRPLTLRTRFQLLILGIILISFLMHAGATFLYFRQSSRKYPYEQLEQRLRMVRKAAAMRLQESGWHLPDPGGFVEDLSEVYETDVNLYDPQGRLLAASEQSVYNNDILAPRMDLWAWRQFRDFGAHTFIHHERAGRFPYLMGYLPLESSDGQVLGFLGVPHYASQSDLRAGLSEFMTTIITVYVLLLIIAGSIAILTFRTLTKPLSDLADSISRVKLGHNEPLPWPNTNDEISELVNQFNKMQQRLEEQKERLFQAERESAWREMARQVTHEIKTPLTPMKLKVELLLSMLNNGSPPDEHQIRRTFHSLIEQINSLSHIASAFNDFAQINDPKPELFLLNDLASSVFELFAGGHEEVQFHLYLPDRQFFVFSDRELLRRVLNNLLKNALEAIPSGRMGVIELRLQQEEADRVLLSVRDNGCGIPAEKQNTIFTPNFTTKSTGMGLGLAMCKKIIEKLHGDIFFESVEGQGTIFYVSLPLEEVQQLQEI
ncbi:MAG: sensor histidine kinase [Bacteroidetes bacterium]|nr:MAG: sensor histidine kinase [Bacteroidota bacterium]